MSRAWRKHDVDRAAEYLESFGVDTEPMTPDRIMRFRNNVAGARAWAAAYREAEADGYGAADAAEHADRLRGGRA